ncbi:MAG: ribokinase [Verrucomicrobiae bacterium]
MSRIFNLGSVNIDHVYQVPHLVRPGETLSSTGYSRGAGGKGFNQSVALARAGASVSHIGCIGADGEWLREFLTAEGVDCQNLLTVSGATGHAIIQVVPQGENAIVLHGGANADTTGNLVSSALESSCAGDWFLCQNETSHVEESLRLARAAGLKTAYNAAPADTAISGEALRHVDLLIVNETEAAALGKGDSPQGSVARVREAHPQMQVILTLGAEGAIWSGSNWEVSAAPPACTVVDTTAAGDTFAGYCLAALMEGLPPAAALDRACRAAAISVTRPGAAQSIPRSFELA